MDKKKIDWDFKPGVDIIVTDDFFYDITDGGYIEADALLNDQEQINKVNDVVNTLMSFKEALIEADLLDFI